MIYEVKVYIEISNPAVDQVYSYIADSFLAQGVRVKVNFNNKLVIGFVDSCQEIIDLGEYEKKLGYTLKKIDEVLDNKPLLNDELLELGKWMSKETITPVISCFQAMLPKILKPKSTTKKESLVSYLTYIKELDNLTTKQREILEQIKKQDIKKSEISSSTIVKRLIDLGAIAEIKKEKEYSLGEYPKNDEMPLTMEQEAVYQDILNTQRDVYLIQGVTGSGKTEVYLHLAKHYLEMGQRVLILVPEISLTPQMVKRVLGRFQDKVAIYHSGLNDNEKLYQYRLINEGKVRIIVGTRSAIFMPIDNLGLIILDEEHDQSYKQDNSPRYHCRDIALYRGKYHHAKVILGSATPSLESYARAYKDIYKLEVLDKRVFSSLPKTTIVDMNREAKQGNPIISKLLNDKIKERLEKKQQVILLLNRRGYATVLKCDECGKVIHCPHCDVPMCYHKQEKLLKCHICGSSLSPRQVCECGNDHFTSYGIGTEKLEETIRDSFDCNVVRLDRDVSSKKGSSERIYQEFQEGKYDILVGTQMISKGLDFPNVTLVGILNGDALLSRMDYRASEMTFDLLVQAVGRSGRGENDGEAIIQVNNPAHYTIPLAMSQNYNRFFKKEMKYRHLANYPPYSYFISFIVSNADEDIAYRQCKMIKDWLKEHQQDDLLGPADILKHQDLYRYRLLYRSKNLEEMKKLTNQLYEEIIRKDRNNTKYIIDVNPLGLEQ